MKKRKKPSLAITKPSKLRKANPDDYHYMPLTEAELVEELDEDLKDAWQKLYQTATALGEQRVYTSSRAIMFARRICYMFVRPKKKYLELTFFANMKIKHPLIHRVDTPTKTKFSHVVRLVHADQIDEPLTDWLTEAFALGG